MADTFCQKELTDYKIKILRQANTCGLRFYNCIESSGIQDFDRFPFAVMNPNKISGRGDFGRERIDGSFMSSSSSALDFSHLLLLVFKEMSDSLVKTTELIMNDYFREMDKAVLTHKQVVARSKYHSRSRTHTNLTLHSALRQL